MTTEAKKILFVMRHAPYGNSLAREGLDALLACAAFEQKVSVLFLNDGVFQLLKNQQSDAIEQKSLEKSLTALPLYDVNELFADQQSLIERQLDEEQLCLPVTTLSVEQINTLFQQQDTIFQF